MSKLPTKWFGRNVLDESHRDDLEHAAAVYEFRDGLPRAEAEAKAYEEYGKAHHEQAAAHHLRGMRAARAAGDIEEAHKHGIAYSLHMGKLGHDPMDQVPESVRALAEGEDLKPHYRFKAHKGDALLLD